MMMILVNMVIFGPCADHVNLVYTFHTFTARSTEIIHSHLLLGKLHSLWHFISQNLYFFSPLMNATYPFQLIFFLI